MKKIIVAICILTALGFAACSKMTIEGRVAKNVKYYTRDYAATPNDIYYAVRWALKEADYPVSKEQLASGLITTAWIPVTSDSHYVKIFDRRDYGATNSYYQLKVYVVKTAGRTTVRVGAPVKTLVANVYSSGLEEKKVLDQIGDYLRTKSPDLTNFGVNE